MLSAVVVENRAVVEYSNISTRLTRVSLVILFLTLRCVVNDFIDTAVDLADKIILSATTNCVEAAI